MDEHRCFLFQLVLQNVKILYHLSIILTTLFALCDVIAQSILVCPTSNAYHYSSNCSKDISLLDCLGLQNSCCDRSVILSICILRYINHLHSLTDFTNLWILAIWIAAGAPPLSIVQGQDYSPLWSVNLTIAGLTLSMTVNALVTGLITFKIFKVFQEVKTATADDQILGVTGGSTLHRVIFIIIESGMALFSIQLTRLVAAIVTTDAADDVYYLISGIHEMFNVIMTINNCYFILLIT